MQQLSDQDLDLVAGGLYVKAIIGNYNTNSFNTGGVYIEHAHVTVGGAGSNNYTQIGSNGGLLSNNRIAL